MKLALAILALLALAQPSLAENAPAPAAAPANTAIIYELRDLKPAGITQYSAAGDIVRQYFQFRNEQGSHHVIYEEVPLHPPARAVVGLRQMASAFDSLCSIDIECSSKAFCTGDCKSMYYEMSNAPSDASAPDRNKCKVQFFTCEKAQLSAPAPAKLENTDDVPRI